MNENHQTAEMELQSVQVEEAPTLLNLLELYSHDFSEFCHVDVEKNRRFEYPTLPLYWSELDRHPFFIRSDGRLAGLVMVQRGSELSGNATVWDLAEMFVLRGCRRQGLGTRAAHAVLSRFQGCWEIRVMQTNTPAHLFWERTVSNFTRQPAQSVPVERNGKLWHLFSFKSGQW